AQSHFLGSDWSKIDPFVWLERPFLLTAGLGIFLWCMLRRTGPEISAVLAISVTLLFYRAGYINYQMVPFLLILYWAFSEWQRLVEQPALVVLLSGCFGLLAILEFAHWGVFFAEFTGLFYGSVIMLKFFLCCALLTGLIQFSSGRAITIVDHDILRPR